jgi:hypothetical protein
MPISGTEVRVGVNGTVYVAASGTTPPANITAPWTGFTDVGYIGDDGVKVARSMTTEQIKAWQSISTIRYLITDVGEVLSFTMMQFNKTTLPFYMGGGTVVAQGGGSYKLSVSSAPTIDERVLGVEWTDGGITSRLIVPRGMVTETQEMTVGRSDAIRLGVSFAAMTPATGSELSYVLTNDSAFA